MLVKKLYEFQNISQRFLIGRLYALKRKPKIKYNKFEHPKKILIVVAGLLGDSVMSTPGIIAARSVWKNSHITLLGKPHNCDLLAACPLIDRFYKFQEDPLSLRNRRKIRHLKNWLAEEHFDVGILLLGTQYAHLLANAKIPVIVGEKRDWQESCLTHQFEVESPRLWGPTHRLNSIRCLGYHIEDIKPQLWVNEIAKASAKEKLKRLQLDETENYVVVHPFGSTKNQWWQMEKVNKLAETLLQDYGVKTVLIGGKETVPYVSKDCSEKIINTTGNLSLPELLAVIDNSKMVITTDSGPFHIAGALKKKSIGLFRARRPEHAKHYSTAKVVFGQNVECDKACQWDYCQSHPCLQLNQISVGSIVNLIGELNLTNSENSD